MARELLNMATDDSISDATKLRAITEALDRGGVAAKTEVEVTARPYETIMQDMEMQGGSRAAHRGEPEPKAIEPANDDSTLDVEIVDDDTWPITPADDEHGSPFDSGPGIFEPTSPPPPDRLMSYEAAASAAAAYKRNHAVVRPGQRALPRGRS